MTSFPTEGWFSVYIWDAPAPWIYYDLPNPAAYAAYCSQGTWIESQVDFTQSSPTLIIDPASVIVSQAVNNFTFNGQAPSSSNPVALVQGKSTAIQATVTAQNVSPSDNSMVTVTASLPDGSQATGQVGIQAASASGGAQVKLLSLVPTSESLNENLIVTATDAADGATQGQAQESVEVKQTNPLGVVYVPVTGYFGAVSDDPGGTVQEHAGMSDAFMQGIFPVAEGGISSQISATPVTGSTLVANTTVTENVDRVQADMLTVLIAGLRVNPQARNVVGVVPQSYFLNHTTGNGPNDLNQFTAGTTNSPQSAGQPVAPVSLVTDGYWESTAHEIGHTFGLQHPTSLPGVPESSVPVNGFWVDQNLSLNGALDFMDAASALFQRPGAISNEWISSSEYGALFNSLLGAPNDPQVLIVAGMLSNSGTVNLQPTFFIQNGITTPYVSSSAGLVQSIGSDGSIIAQGSFSPSFNLVTNTWGLLPTDSSIFLVQLPVSQSADTVQVLQDGKVLTSFNPNSQLLIDAIQAIPDTSFKRDAKREERSLLRQARRIESFLNFCQSIRSDKLHDNWLRIACTDSVEERVLALREEINRDLNDSTETESPLQMTKGEVLNTVDYIALQLLGSPTVQASGRPFVIKVLPGDSQEVLRIVSTTQGEHGSVYINSNGSLSYKPDPGKREPDSFTVTVEDAEGLTRVITVTVALPCLDNRGIGRWGDRFAHGKDQR